MKFKYLIIFPVILLTGCLTAMDKTGQLLDGTASSQKRVALYRQTENENNIELKVVRNKQKEQSIIIETPKYPMIKFYASYPDNENNFYFTGIYYLGGTAGGWNEYMLDILGGGTLLLGETAVLSVTDEIEEVQISSGRIHRYDTRITGTEALTLLRNRRERILALTQWMADNNTIEKELTFQEFDEYWKPVLFPEIVTSKKRPLNWDLPQDEYIRAEDIRWNTSYTERVFNETLSPVRNSGTMLRDWEEASAWIYIEYYMQNIIELFNGQITLTKIK